MLSQNHFKKGNKHLKSDLQKFKASAIKIQTKTKGWVGIGN